MVDGDRVLDGWERGEGRKFERLAAAVERALVAGHLAGPLPSERALASRLGISRGTVSAAYAELKERRLVTSRAGGYTRADVEQLKAPVRAARLAARGMADGTLLSTYVDRDPSALDLAFAVSGIPERLRDLVMHAYAAALDESPSSDYLAAGRPELRERIAEMFRAQGVPTIAEQIVVTQGAYQAIVLSTLLALQPGDRVACECPMYPGALDVFRAHAATIYAVDSYDREHVLERLEREGNIDLIYASSVYRNPTGSVIDHATAARLVRLAATRTIITIDDRALEHCGFVPNSFPPLAAYDRNAPVLTLGSLDKTTGAGTRIGWIRAPRRLAAQLTRLKALSDLASPAYMQGVALRLFAHLPVIAAEHQRERQLRYAAASAAFATHVPAWTWPVPRGGSSLWIDTGMNADALVLAAARAGVTLTAGGAFYPSGVSASHIRVAITRSPEVLDRAIARLAGAVGALEADRNNKGSHAVRRRQDRQSKGPDGCAMGIEDILRLKDEKRGKGGKQDAYEREVQARFTFSEHVATALINAILALRDKALGEPVRLPIAAKPSETPVFIECEGLVRLTLLCHIRADLHGDVYCSAIDLGMSRNSGRTVRGQFEPVRPNSGARATKFGFPEKLFTVDAAKFKAAIEAMAHQL